MVFNKLMKMLKRKKTAKNKLREAATKKKIKAKKPAKRIVKSVKTAKGPKAAKETIVGEAIHYFSKIKVVILKMKGMLSLNDKIHIKGHTTDFSQNVTSLQINHQSVNTVKKGQEIGLLVKGKVRHKDKVYKVA